MVASHLTGLVYIWCDFKAEGLQYSISSLSLSQFLLLPSSYYVYFIDK